MSQGQWHEEWKGQAGSSVLIIKPSTFEVLTWVTMKNEKIEDGRLFRDDQGKIRLMYNRWQNGDDNHEDFKKRTHRGIFISEVSIGSGHEIKIHNEQVSVIQGDKFLY